MRPHIFIILGLVAWNGAILTRNIMETYIVQQKLFIVKEYYKQKKKKKNSAVLVRKRTIPTERPPHVGEVSASFCG
jgi:hypothetical protein